MKRRGLDIFLAGFMLVGVVLLIVGVVQLVETRRFLAKSVAAGGEVVEITRVIEWRSVGSGKGEHRERVPYYYPVVRFVTPLEEVVQFESGDDGSTEPEKYRVGQSLRILYDPANPQDARLDTASGRWGRVIVPRSCGPGLHRHPGVHLFGGTPFTIVTGDERGLVWTIPSGLVVLDQLADVDHFRQLLDRPEVADVHAVPPQPLHRLRLADPGDRRGGSSGLLRPVPSKSKRRQDRFRSGRLG